MKKLNRKGFTLIELLAIIVILAIIMVVTIPTILDMMGNATKTEFENSANAIEKWVSDQYVLAVVGQASDAFEGICGPTGSGCTSEKTLDSANFSTDTTADYKFLHAAGQVPGNYSEVKIKVDASTNRVCVKVKPSTTGDFSGVDATNDTESNGC